MEKTGSCSKRREMVGGAGTEGDATQVAFIQESDRKCGVWTLSMNLSSSQNLAS